ncbi:MAG: ATP-binding cassette subfamily C protein CydD [Motiliproteus sp.]|jgi:ATP-binding cassette subfamily C protein CydD
MKQTATLPLDRCPDAKAFLLEAGNIARTENAWLTLIGVLQILSTLGFAALIALMINSAVYQQQDLWKQPLWWIGLASILCMKAGLPLLQARLADRASIKIRARLRAVTLAHCQQLHIHLFPDFTAAELSTLLSTEINSMRDYFAEFLPQQRLAMLAPLLVMLACSTINWLVPLILALTAPIVPVFMVIVGHKAAAASQRNLIQLNRLGNLLSDRVRGMSALQLAGTATNEQESLYQQSERYRRSTMQVLRLAFLSGTVLEFFSAISVALVAVYLGLFFLGKYQLGSWSDSISLGEGVFLLMLAPAFYLPLRRLGALYHARAEALSVAEHLLSLLRKKAPALAMQPQPQTQHRLDEPIDSVVLRALQAGREGRKIAAPINVTLLPGQSVLLQGPSGVGKSTLLDTLAGFLPPLSGQILINGQFRVLENCDDWKGRIGYMTQHPELLFDSIRNNLCLGRDFTEQQLFAALAAAQVEQVVRDLPETLDYRIADQGGFVSGGQAQRIALARVFLHQPRLLLLDEPTANLDDQTAELFLQSLHQFTLDGGMLIIASHRLGHQQRFDQVIQFEATGSDIAAEGCDTDANVG